MGPRVCVLFFLLLSLTGATGTVLVIEDWRGRELPSGSESFQSLIGGLGIGPALYLSDSAADFDPRLEGNDSMDHSLIAGGACFSSRQGSSAFFYSR